MEVVDQRMLTWGVVERDDGQALMLEGQTDSLHKHMERQAYK